MDVCVNVIRTVGQLHNTSLYYVGTASCCWADSLDSRSAPFCSDVEQLHSLSERLFTVTCNCVYS